MIVVALLFASSLSAVGHAQKTSAGYDQNVNFSNYKTFSFDATGARNPFVNEIIVAAVERELTSRGLKKVNSDSDLLVVYLAASGPNLQVASVPFYTQSSTQSSAGWWVAPRWQRGMLRRERW